MIDKRLIFLMSVLFLTAGTFISAETVTGNGYIVEQTLFPLQGSLSGNGYTVQQNTQVIGGEFAGGSNLLFSSFGASSSTSATTSTPITPQSITISGGYYVFPQTATATIVSSSSFATSSPTLTSSTILTTNGTTCTTRITFSAPIDIRSQNNVEDVKKLESFLNLYEGENLPINGVYEKQDVEAVKRWQAKYRSFILDPMRLKNPTGTVYALSQRQIERQTTKSCGEPILVTACPFFRSNVKYGDRGEEVKKVQQFLNIVQGEKIPLSGVFGPLTKEAVKRFQKSQRVYVATFIPVRIATGNWYATTRIKANETIGCDILK